MSRNPCNYIFIVLLVLFTCALSMPHRAAAPSLFTKGGAISSTDKPVVSIHRPADSAGADDESFFENETEDENKAGFDATLPFEDPFHRINGHLILKGNAVTLPLTGSYPDTEQALYLSICAFRI